MMLLPGSPPSSPSSNAAVSSGLTAGQAVYPAVYAATGLVFILFLSSAPFIRAYQEATNWYLWHPPEFK